MAANMNELLQKLTVGEDNLHALHEVRRAIYSVQLDELRLMMRNVSLEPVFTSIGSSENKALEIGGDILSRLLECLEPEVALGQLHDELYMGMGHPSKDIRRVCIHQIERLINSQSGIGLLQKDPDMLANVISMVADESLAVAKLAIKSLKAVGQDLCGANLLFEGEFKAQLTRLAANSDTVKYRIFEIAICVAAISIEAMEIVKLSGLLQQLVSDLHTDDDLIQLNAIEMLCSLTDTPHGVKFLEEDEVIRKLEGMLIQAQDNATQDFLLPELLKFFGSLSRHHPTELCERYPAFLSCSFGLLNSSEMPLVNIAVETIGFIGKSTAGKRALDKHENSMTVALSLFGKFIQVPPTEVQVRTLSALASLFSVEREELNEDLEAVLQQWFKHISAKPLELILSLCKQPFLEIRCPALSIIQAIVGHRWAQMQFLENPGFQEYLLDRSTENEKPGKEAKFDAVKALAEAYPTADVFGRPYLLKLRGFVREGPYYVQSQTEVIIEGND